MIHATGKLAEIAQYKNDNSRRESGLAPVRTILDNSIQISVMVGINLYVACINKMKLNAQKYPLKICTQEVSIAAVGTRYDLTIIL